MMSYGNYSAGFSYGQIYSIANCRVNVNSAKVLVCNAPFALGKDLWPTNADLILLLGDE